MPVYRVYTVGTPFNAAELQEMDFEQTADVVYFAHQNHDPLKLVRHGHTNWEFKTVNFGASINPPASMTGVAVIDNRDAPNSGNAYFPQNSSYVVTAFNEDTGQESKPSSQITLFNDLSLKRNYNSLSWPAVSGATGYRIYKSDNTQSYGNIGTTDKLSFIDDNIGADLSSGPPVHDNPFTNAGDKPSTITFHEQRAWWGRTLNVPNGLFGSRSADYENMDFTRPGREDDSIIIGLVANKVNSVNHLVSSEQGLLALTSNNIFAVQGSNEDYITATPPPRVRPKVRRGASRLKPISLDSIVFYETSKFGEIRTIGYDFELDGLKTNDITVFSRHLFKGRTVKAWAYAEKPSSCFYVVLDNGQCLCLTWDQAQEVWGWTVLETDGLFLDVATIYEQAEDRVYFIIKRTLASGDKYYLERMASEMWSDQKDACYLDCARTFNNANYISIVDRLDHLEGKTVVAWVDGAAIYKDINDQPLVVTNGQISLPIGGKVISVGLPFTAEIKTLPLAIQTGQGWNVARPQQSAYAVARVIDTRNVFGGVDADQLFPIKQREHEDYDDPIALFTGDMEIDLGGTSGTSQGASVFLRSSDPTPMEIAAVLIEPKFGDQS